MTGWRPEGTPVKGPIAPWRPGCAAGAEYLVAMLTHQDWMFGKFSWPTTNLMLMRSEDWHAVRVSWSSAGKAMGWYVNFQRLSRRTERGIQTMDLMLDLIVNQDRTWKWKDKDEFEALATPGIITNDEARYVRDDAQEMLARIEANEPPLCDPWHDWQPSSSWTTPHLPDDWHII